MAKSNLAGLTPRILLCLLSLLIIAADPAWSEDKGGIMPVKMVLIEGGTFVMGDVFGEGEKNEIPTHQVTVSSFYMSPHEVTAGEFKAFTLETGYKTSAESPDDQAARKKIMEKFASGDLTPEEMKDLKREFLQLPGAGYWDAEKRQWTGYNPLTNWRNPGFQQADDHPVIAVSVDDAMHYCNWLSEKSGLPVAYDLATGDFLDEQGKQTSDITKVRGYRLPTEAEWEYAAREGGRKVRFGTGKNTARASEINFRADDGEYAYLETGEYRMATTKVGSFPPNGLGLFDMSGNAWEWAGDCFSKYVDGNQTNPCATDCDMHALRGGRWGGDAFEARVFSRSSWVRNDRCNNSGFRIARSK